MPSSALSMAVEIASSSNVNSYVSGAFLPSPNKLYLLAVVHSDAAPEATVPTVTSTTGLTFVQVGSSVPFDTIASNVHRLTVFRALKPTGTALSSGTYTVALADNGTGLAAMLIEINAVNLGGSDGASAIVQSPTNSANAGANPNVNLSAFASANNGVVLFAASDIQTAPTADTGWVEIGTNPDYNTPATGLACFWRPDNDTTATCTLTASDWGAMAIEVSYAHNVEALLGWQPRFSDRVPAKTEVAAYGETRGVVES